MNAESGLVHTVEWLEASRKLGTIQCDTEQTVHPSNLILEYARGLRESALDDSRCSKRPGIASAVIRAWFDRDALAKAMGRSVDQSLLNVQTVGKVAICN